MSLFTKLGRKIIGKPGKHYEWVSGPLTYNRDGLATRHNCDFMQAPRFTAAYAAG